MISGIGTGSRKLCIPLRRLPVSRSGTLAMRSVARARASAAEKPSTIVTISRSSVRARYLLPIVITTLGHALVQTANNTAAMGTVFAAGGMRITFAVAGGLMVIALAIAGRLAQPEGEASVGTASILH